LQQCHYKHFISFKIGATKYSWTADLNGAVWQCSGTFDLANGSIAETLVNNTDAPIKVTYHITPTIYNRCDLTTVDVDVWVNPTRR
jgi:hypothetical protein